MNTKAAYTPDQERDAKRFLDIVASVPPEKRFLVAIATEAFVNGMAAQERVASGPAAPAPAAAPAS